MGRGPGKNQIVIRFRAPENLKQRLERILERRGHGDLSELIRHVLYDYVEAEEHRLRMNELRFADPADTLMVAEEPNELSSAARRAKAK